jgi:hypothetical protein
MPVISHLRQQQQVECLPNVILCHLYNRIPVCLNAKKGVSVSCIAYALGFSNNFVFICQYPFDDF